MPRCPRGAGSQNMQSSLLRRCIRWLGWGGRPWLLKTVCSGFAAGECSFFSFFPLWLAGAWRRSWYRPQHSSPCHSLPFSPLSLSLSLPPCPPLPSLPSPSPLLPSSLLLPFPPACSWTLVVWLVAFYFMPTFSLPHAWFR